MKNSEETLIGANVTVKGELIGTVTDFDGNFSITVDLNLPILVFTHRLCF
ncbi:MAG: carboxypeptidase-like regulatory domain-containing protein [Chitinophagales bacterium]